MVMEEGGITIGRRRGGMMIGIGGNFLILLISSLRKKCEYGSICGLSKKEFPQGHLAFMREVICMEWNGREGDTAMSQLSFSLVLRMDCRYRAMESGYCTLGKMILTTQLTEPFQPVICPECPYYVILNLDTNISYKGIYGDLSSTSILIHRQ